MAAAVAGDADGHADQLAADGRVTGFGVQGPGQAAGGAGQFVADGGQGQPYGVGGEMPRRQVGEGAAGQVREDLKIMSYFFSKPTI